MKVSIVIEQDKYGYYAYAPELPGCHSQGASFEEADSNIREAIDLYLETLDPAELSNFTSKNIYTSSYEYVGA
jgi:predicted RNase H-like HicB family nuclease